jgi:lipopolysaccharide assembly protein A
MRWVHMTIIVVLAAAITIFAVQNLQIVTTSFLGFSARVPISVLAACVYLLGAVTGGSLLALIRQSIEGAKRRTGTMP